jgi:ferredoxin
MIFIIKNGISQKLNNNSCHTFLYLQQIKKKNTTAMAIMITDECINCGACEPECPNNAIYEGGAEWKYSDGTSLKGMITTLNGDEIEADDSFEPVDMDVYYIVHDKCTECEGFHDEPQCAAVCPVDCCVDDPEYRESKDELMAKKDFMHID